MIPLSVLMRYNLFWNIQIQKSKIVRFGFSFFLKYSLKRPNKFSRQKNHFRTFCVHGLMLRDVPMKILRLENRSFPRKHQDRRNFHFLKTLIFQIHFCLMSSCGTVLYSWKSNCGLVSNPFMSSECVLRSEIDFQTNKN